MLDIGMVEMLVIGAVALIVVGPKELPRLVRTVGQWVGRARSLARDFQRGMEDAARSADMDDLRKVGDLKGEIEADVNKISGFDDFAPRRASPPPPPKTVSDPTRSSAAQPSAPAERRPAPKSQAERDDDDLLSGFERGVRGDGAGEGKGGPDA